VLLAEMPTVYNNCVYRFFFDEESDHVDAVEGIPSLTYSIEADGYSCFHYENYTTYDPASLELTFRPSCNGEETPTAPLSADLSLGYKIDDNAFPSVLSCEGLGSCIGRQAWARLKISSSVADAIPAGQQRGLCYIDESCDDGLVCNAGSCFE